MQAAPTAVTPPAGGFGGGGTGQEVTLGGPCHIHYPSRGLPPPAPCRTALSLRSQLGRPPRPSRTITVSLQKRGTWLVSLIKKRENEVTKSGWPAWAWAGRGGRAGFPDALVPRDHSTCHLVAADAQAPSATPDLAEPASCGPLGGPWGDPSLPGRGVLGAGGRAVPLRAPQTCHSVGVLGTQQLWSPALHPLLQGLPQRSPSLLTAGPLCISTPSPLTLSPGLTLIAHSSPWPLSPVPAWRPPKPEVVPPVAPGSPAASAELRAGAGCWPSTHLCQGLV